MEPINFTQRYPGESKRSIVQLVRHITGQGEQGSAYAPHIHTHTNADERPV